MPDHADPGLGRRPALEDTRERQQTVVTDLERPFETMATLMDWKRRVVECMVGRIPDGLRVILAEPEIVAVNTYFFFDEGWAGREFRLQMQEALAVAFAWPLEDLSRITAEIPLPGKGIGQGGLTPAWQPTTFR